MNARPGDSCTNRQLPGSANTLSLILEKSKGDGQRSSLVRRDKPVPRLVGIIFILQENRECKRNFLALTERRASSADGDPPPGNMPATHSATVCYRYQGPQD